MDADASRSTGLIGVLAWLEVNKKRLLIGAGAGFVVVFSGVILIQRQAQKEATASQALSDVRVPLSAGTQPPAGMTEALLKMANDYKGTKAAARALLLSAGLLFAENTEKSYAEAQKRFAQVAQDYPDSPWLAEANLGVASSLAALGKTAEATAKFEEARRRFASSSVIDDIKLGLARLYQGPKPEEAFKLYDEVVKENPNTAVAMEANLRQEDLLKLRPELAKLREPPAPPLTTTTLLTNQTIKVNAATTQAATLVTNLANRLLTNLQPSALTNRSGTSQPVSLKVDPVAPPGK